LLVGCCLAAGLGVTLSDLEVSEIACKKRGIECIRDLLELVVSDFSGRSVSPKVSVF